MNIWGISANGHDAAVSVWNDKQLKFAAHSERYSGVKGDGDLSFGLLQDALRHGWPDLIVWYESPWLKTARQFYAGQGWQQKQNNIKKYLSKYHLDARIVFGKHHRSHAAGGYYTSGLPHATVIVIDAIGEFECMTVWEGNGNKLDKVYSQSYPHSLGLWYSAMTQRCGLKPNEEEYILMGMAAYGDPKRLKNSIYEDFFKLIDMPKIKFKQNLHRGCLSWRPDLNSINDQFDIAAATQEIYTELLQKLTAWARKKFSSDNLVLMGGCALNCVANSSVTGDWNKIWIMPNPGDAGSSVGAVAAYLREHVSWSGPYLGHKINGNYPANRAIELLKTEKIVGVANGCAEFGPRALGHRSLLADPRDISIKSKINLIKQRQKFRPFAPAILEEHAHRYFDMPRNLDNSPYMQFVATCKNPDMFPAIVHADGTSRVQTVGKNDSTGFRRLLEGWYEETGCPMLLNTSLNIRGQPMVNDLKDCREFYRNYNIPVLTND